MNNTQTHSNEGVNPFVVKHPVSP